MLVLEPTGGTGGGGDGDTPGHEAILYFRPLAGRDTDEFFGDSRYGEFWVGARPTIEDIEAELGITARHIDEFADAVAKDAGQARHPGRARVRCRGRRRGGQGAAEAADAAGTATAEQRVEAEHEADDELSSFLSHLRMTKDEWEIEEMRSAIEGTHRGFEAVIADLPEAIRRGRGERWVEVSSASMRGTTATASATTRSARVVTTPTPCTGSRTRARSRRATCSCSTQGSRSTRSSRPTSRGPSR